MTEIFIDIENTLIDDLYSCTLLEEQCKRISSYVLEKIAEHEHGMPVKVSLFTWGWKTKVEIRDYIVKWLFDTLEIPTENRGRVWTKDDSIECAYKHKWVNTKDELEIEDLHIPGAMNRYGLNKQMCFVQQAMDESSFPSRIDNTETDEFILIDDTNNRWYETRSMTTYDHNVEVIITFEHPEEI